MKTVTVVVSICVLWSLAEARWQTLGTTTLEAALVYGQVKRQVSKRLTMTELWEAYKRRVSN